MSQRNESGLTAIEEGKLVALAVRKGWIGSKRFDTRRTRKQLQDVIDKREGDATLIERCELTAHQLMESSNYKEKAQGAAIVERMERQNLAAERVELEIEGAIGPTLDPLTNSPPNAEPEPAQVVNNTQIIIYTPDNGRGPAPAIFDASTSGHSTNGKH